MLLFPAMKPIGHGEAPAKPKAAAPAATAAAAPAAAGVGFPACPSASAACLPGLELGSAEGEREPCTNPSPVL